MLDIGVEDGFVDWLRDRGLSDATGKTYRYGLRRFARWYLLSRGKVLEPGDPTQSDIDDYGKSLWGLKSPPERKNRLAGGSVSVFLSSAKTFLTWASTRATDDF